MRASRSEAGNSPTWQRKNLLSMMGGEIIIWDIKACFRALLVHCGLQKGSVVDFRNSPFFGCIRVEQVLRTYPCSQLDDLCLDEKVPVLGLHRRRGERAFVCKSARVLKLCGNISTPLKC